MWCYFDYDKPRFAFRISRPFGYGQPCPADHVDPVAALSPGIKTLVDAGMIFLPDAAKGD